MTKANSKPDWTLSNQQELAVDLLAIGRNITETAESLGIARQTISQWVNHHCGFQAALNRRQQDLWRGCADKLRALLPKALDTLANELDCECSHKLKAAEAILKAAGLFWNVPQPSNLTTAEDVEKDKKMVEEERKSEMSRRALMAMPY